jgi:tetratricopeptide (TPR) repeat protein
MLPEHLTALESSGLIRLAMLDPEIEYLFRHALIQEAAYESILKQDRRALHLAVGEVLERISPDQLEELDGLLAYHYSRAELWDKTFKYARSAAQRAKGLYAMTEALAYYDLAVKALDQLDLNPADKFDHQHSALARFDLLSERHGASTRLGQLQRTHADLLTMVALARELHDDPRLSDALTGLGDLYFTLGPVESAEAALDEALTVKRRLGDPARLADSLNNLAGLYFGMGKLVVGEATYAEAHTLYEAVGDPDGLARNELMMGACQYNFVNDYERALAHLEQSTRLSQQSGNRALEWGAALLMGATYVVLGDYESGRSYLDRVYEWGNQVDDRTTIGWARLYLSWADREQGDYPLSESRAKLALELARSVGEKYLAWYALISLARLSIIGNHLSEARAYAQEAYQLCQARTYWASTLVWSLNLLARVSSLLGLDDSRQLIDTTLQELDAMNGSGVADVQSLYFDCYLTLKSLGEVKASELLQQAYRALMARANTLNDPVRRGQFLSGVMSNREIMAEWELLGLQKS